jgi:hypothetical protein
MRKKPGKLGLRKKGSALIYDLGNGQWNIPKLRGLLEKILPPNSVFNDFEVAQSFEDISPKSCV